MANLIVYYSRKGQNYWNGSIVDLVKGNTERVTEFVQKAVGDELFEIETVREYSKDYMVCIEEAKEELREHARPELKRYLDSLDGYDIIFVGYPNWWGEIPNIVYTFMENHAFAGKTVIPFNTHEGSGQSHSQRDIEKTLPDAIVLKGLAVRGATAQNDADATAKAVTDWLSGLGM